MSDEKVGCFSCRYGFFCSHPLCWTPHFDCFSLSYGTYHYKYVTLKKNNKNYKYTYWEPNKELKTVINLKLLLTDKDFEL